MLISDLEAILNITITGTPQEARYTAFLAGAIAHIDRECGARFTDATTGLTTLPPDVQIGAALVVKSMSENQNVASQSLGDMSKSFFQGATYKSAISYWYPYRRVTRY